MAQEEPTPAPAPPPLPHVEFKATLLLGLMVLLVAGAALYLMYARGVFEATQSGWCSSPRMPRACASAWT